MSKSQSLGGQKRFGLIEPDHQGSWGMNREYALFVAYATLQAFSELESLLQKHRTTPTIEVMTDAARLGITQALQRFFFNRPAPPYRGEAVADVVSALRFHYSISKAPLSMPTPLPLREEGTARAQAVPSVVTPPPNAIPGATTLGRPPAAAAGASARFRTATDANNQVDDESKATPTPQGGFRTPNPVTPTKLKRVGRAPIFPWERKSSTEKTEESS